MKVFKILAVSAFLLISVQSIGQQKKLDKLEMYYDQGNYPIVYRKAKRYMSKPEFDNSPAPIFYKTLAEYKMAIKGNGKFKVDDALKHYQEFKKKDLDGSFSRAHKGEITDFKNNVQSYIQDIAKKGSKSEAKKYLALANETFDDSKNYADVIDHNFEDKKEVKVENEVVTTIAATELRDNIIMYSKNYIGVPYKWGGTTANGFDCSGFTQYVMKKHGIDLPRIAGDQYYKSAKKVSVKKAQKGDLVFFGKGNKVSHVGIVVSNPGEPLTMIHASSSRGIMISNIEKSTYWKPKLLFVGSVVKS